jgi:CubicO group peptidase (beta-lactamase class C family)
MKKTNRSGTLITVLITLFICLISAKNSMASTELKTIEKIITHKTSIEKQAVGVSVVIINGDKTEYLSLGLANKKSKEKISANTLFEIGSVSKTFTALALASMVREGKIKLTDPVQNHLPKQVTLPVKNGKHITFLSLSNHSSGLPRLPTNMPFSNPLNPYEDYTVEMMYEFLNDYKLPREVGEVHEYSNLAVGLLGHVLALIDNKSYQDMITDRVLTPLNMENTFVNIPASKTSLISDGHNDQLNVTEHWQLPTLAGAGALNSSATDMASYLKANMSKEQLSDEFTLSHTSTGLFGNPDTKIGLGWIILKGKDNPYYMHNGGTGGFRSFIAFDQKQQKGIVILTNSIFELDEIGHAFINNQLNKVQLTVPIHVAKEDLNKLNGKFQLVPNFVLTITNDESQLFVQATGQQKLTLTAISKTEYVNQAVKAKIIFEVNEAGKATSLTMYQGGQTLPGVKL